MYNDIPYIAETLKVPVGKLYMLSNNYKPRKKRKGSIYENYHTVVIHHGRGHKNRTLNVPNAFLKLVQRRLLDNFLYQLKVSEYSTAYCKGNSLLDNAAPHVGKECVLKLDISHFFDSIDDDKVLFVMKRLGVSITATVLFTHLCTYKGKLPQGAPTSPYIANLVMKQFDEKLGHWCSEYNITYTRYCDDMTFSGDKADIRSANVISKVRRMLYRMGFTINDKKTVFISSSQQQRVTGIVVNEKPTLSRSQKRTLRQEVYYCQKYGAAESINRKGHDISPDKYLHSLLGRIAFALQVEPDNSEMKEYFETVKSLMNT
ncbi:reverse transcriptase domain-containing protein [Ruminococcus flavefaciens]|uniref:reverse transcriptase domain-containing protein n=1 Tax=Ruminococcus flavefaciens TaxID=1265 RepID=UPI0026EB9BA8|nr:reverse transcriptase domain-containing protein [Ruminococcus flavefaciens]